jgi:hypothetical protein
METAGTRWRAPGRRSRTVALASETCRTQRPSIDPARFGVEADCLFASKELGNAVGSDSDLIVVCSGDAQQRRDLHAWLEDWSLCFAEVSFQFSEQRSSRWPISKNQNKPEPSFRPFAAAGKILQALSVGAVLNKPKLH